MSADPYAALHAKRARADRIARWLFGIGVVACLAAPVCVWAAGAPLRVAEAVALIAGAVELIAVGLVTGTWRVGLDVRIERLCESRYQEGAHTFAAYAAEWHTAFPNEECCDPAVPTLNGGLVFDLGQYADLDPAELDDLTDGLDAEQRQAALVALMEAAWPVYQAKGSSAAYRLLMTVTGGTPAARIVGSVTDSPVLCAYNDQWTTEQAERFLVGFAHFTWHDWTEENYELLRVTHPSLPTWERMCALLRGSATLAAFGTP